MIKELEIKEVEITKKSELKYFMLLQWWKEQKNNADVEYKIFSMMLPN